MTRSTSETGHAINVANFQQLIKACEALGTAYNPANPRLSTQNLLLQHSDAEKTLNEVNKNLKPLADAINQRDELFSSLKVFVTRISGAIQASDISPAAIKDLKTVMRKLQGRKAPGTNKSANEQPDNESTQGISTSQQSFNALIENFDRLVAMLDQEPNYNSNETDLTVAGLKTRLANMRQANNDCLDNFGPLANARLARNNALYAPITGVVDTAKAIKSYVRSVLGSKHPSFAQINGIAFKKTI